MSLSVSAVSALTNTLSASASALPTAANAAFNTTLTQALCAYPVSGSYGLLPRVLFYCTLVFALLFHGHLWLVAAALGAALTFSGTAAFHAILLIWRGPADGANDIDALMAILSTACLISVPLLNWSSTLRRLGATAHDLKEIKAIDSNDTVSIKSADLKGEERDAKEFGARTVVIYWALLVTVGFITVFVIEEWAPGSRSYYPINADLNMVHCAPGTNMSVTTVDSAFVSAHNCTDPCSTIQKSEFFRPNSDLVLLTSAQIALLDADNKVSNAIYYYYDVSEWVFPYIILQGAWTACFGRRSPRQVRDLLWIALTKKSPQNWPKTRATQRGFAGTFAGFVYLGAWFIVFICAPGVVFNIVINELSLAATDIEAEKPYMIGQWGPWCSTGLVLLAAIIGRFHDRTVDFIWRSLKRLFSHKATPRPSQLPAHDAEKGHSPHSSDTQTKPPTKASQPKRRDFFVVRQYHAFLSEWRNFGHWCKDPDAISLRSSRHPNNTLLDSSSTASTEAVECPHKAGEQCNNCASVQPVQVKHVQTWPPTTGGSEMDSLGKVEQHDFGGDGSEGKMDARS